jgi:FkbM family methyltransferase
MVLRLHANLARNGVAQHVTVLPVAASDHSGEATLTALAGKEEYASLGQAEHRALRSDSTDRSGKLDSFTVPTVRLDDIVAQHDLRPGFVKIDVEGAEHLVLEGAQALLDVHRPVVLIEISDERLRGNGSSARAVVEQLTAARYRLLDPHQTDFPPATLARLETPNELEEVLAVPIESSGLGSR